MTVVSPLRTRSPRTEAKRLRLFKRNRNTIYRRRGIRRVVHEHQAGWIPYADQAGVRQRADPSKSFSFEVKLTDESGNPLQGQFAYGLFQGQVPSNWDAWSLGTATTDENGVLSLENGKIALANGQSIAICGLPVGSKYQVQESANDGYSTSVSKTSSAQTQGADSESSSGTITENEQIDSLTFLNEKWTNGVINADKARPRSKRERAVRLLHHIERR